MHEVERELPLQGGLLRSGPTRHADRALSLRDMQEISRCSLRFYGGSHARSLSLDGRREENSLPTHPVNCAASAPFVEHSSSPSDRLNRISFSGWQRSTTTQAQHRLCISGLRMSHPGSPIVRKCLDIQNRTLVGSESSA
jgi:hypothetical protein